jgi:bile acid:Na+ symporter, BASS family
VHPIVMAWIGVLAKVTIPLLMLSVGLASAELSLGYFCRRRRLLLRALAVVNLLVPAVIVGVALALPLPRIVRIGLVLLAIAPGAPFAPIKSVKFGGDPVFAYNLHIIVGVLSIATVPATLALVGRALSFPLHVDITAVSKTVLFGQLVPLAVGLGVRLRWPRIATTVGPSLNIVANVLLVLLIGLFLVARGGALLALGAFSLSSLFLVALSALMIGHVACGPEIGTRRAAAIAGALRHPGLALLIAHVNFPSYELAPVVVAYVLAAALATFAYRAWTERRERVLGRAY